MADLIIVIIIAVIMIFAIRYVYKAKKSGQKCIGCPNNQVCNKQNNCKLKSKNWLK